MFNMRLELQKRRLTSVLFFSSIFPLFLIAICIFLYALHSIDKEYKKIGSSEIHILSKGYSAKTNQEIESALQVIEFLSALHKGEDSFQADLLKAYEELSRSKEWLEGIVIVSDQGERVATAGLPRSQDFESIASTYSATGQTPTRALISDVQANPKGIPYFLITTRIRLGSKTYLASLSINAFLFSATLDKVRIGRTGEVFLINTSGILQTKSVMHGSILDSVDHTLAEQTPHADAVLQREWEGTRLWYIVLPLDTNPNWRIVVQRDEREILQSRDTLLARFIMLGVLCLVALVAIAVRTIKKTRALQDQMEEERAQLTDYHIQVQKLDAISQLGVGLAHEVNNPLAIIGEEAGWMQDVLKRESFKDHPDASELRDSLHQIVAQTARSREITHKLLSFGGKTDGIIRDTNLNTLVADIVTLRRREASQKNIEIREDLARKLPIIHSEPSLLRQLLINLINNSIDAMPDGGQITVSTSSSAEGGVQLRVHDTGFGICEENLCKIFDPFFTTKPPGKGAGLGLSICHGILRRIGGQIFVSSEPGKGTTVTIELPLEARPFDR